MNSYEHLIGKSVEDTVHNRTLIVSQIDPEVGISMHEPETPEHPSWCLIHPYVHATRHKVRLEDLHGDEQYFKDSFDHMVEAIRSGLMDEAWYEADRKLDERVGGKSEGFLGNEYMNNVCPFK